MEDINNLKKSDIWENLLTIAVNFISPKDSDEECATHSKSENKEIMIYDESEKISESIP